MKKMQKIEEVWNIVYYFLYVGLNKFSRFIKAPLDCLIELPPIENLLIRRGGSVDMVREASKDTTENVVLGTSVFYASYILTMLLFLLMVALDFIFIALVFHNKSDTLMTFFCMGLQLLFSILINYYFVDYENKHLWYFKQFRKKPRAWKRKWAWKCLGILLIPVITFVIAVYINKAV